MRIKLTLIISAFCLVISFPAAAFTSCRLTYHLKGWSFFYKEYSGSGFVKCTNGEHAAVNIITRGGGLTIGKSEISHGKGTFSAVKNIREIYGSYIALDGHAGITKSVEGHVMTKGEVSLAISGIGRGFDLGAALGVFIISP